MSPGASTTAQARAACRPRNKIQSQQSLLKARWQRKSFESAMATKVFCKRDGNKSLLQARWQGKHMFCEMEYVCHRVCPTAFEACPGKLIRDKQANTKEGNGPARDQLRQTKVAQNRHGYHPKLFFGYSLTNTLDCNLQRVCW